MVTYPHGNEEKLKRAIRDATALDPIATIPRLTETPLEPPEPFIDPRYIKKLPDGRRFCHAAHPLVMLRASP